jgi:hypothetical protein
LSRIKEFTEKLENNGKMFALIFNPLKNREELEIYMCNNRDFDSIPQSLLKEIN